MDGDKFYEAFKEMAEKAKESGDVAIRTICLSVCGAIKDGSVNELALLVSLFAQKQIEKIEKAMAKGGSD